MVFLVSGGLSEGVRPFPLKILDTKISVNSTSGECINLVLTFGPATFLPDVIKYAVFFFEVFPKYVMLFEFCKKLIIIEKIHDLVKVKPK